jgi:hypothetical protein
MMHLCERCRVATPDLKLNETHNEYWCDNCFDNEAEAAWERQAERDMESPPETSREEHIRTWEEKRRLK